MQGWIEIGLLTVITLIEGARLWYAYEQNKNQVRDYLHRIEL